MSYRPPSLVEQFRTKAPVAAAPAPAVPVPPSPPAAASATPPPTAPSTGKPGVNSWFKENWGKAIAITLVVVITTIFVARTVLVARNKKRAKQEETKALATGVEWESFLEDTPRPQATPVFPPMRPRQPPMGPPFHPQGPPHVPHMQAPVPLHVSQVPQAPPPPPGLTPLPPMNPEGRGGSVMRMPPAEGVHGGMPSVSMMPESTRPLRAAGPPPQPPSAGETFTINSEVPVVAVPEKESDEPLSQEKEAPMIPPDIDVPNTKGTEHTRL